MITDDDELSVQNTASEALISKHSAMRVGYYEDEFLPLFCRRKERKPPLINRGYYTRVQSINLVTQKFLEQTSGAPRQILVVGGGYDTTCLKLLQKQTADVQCFEVDFPALIDRKAYLFMSAPLIKETLFRGGGGGSGRDAASTAGDPAAAPGSMPPPTTPAGSMSNAAAAVAERKRSYGYDMGIGLTLLSADLKNVDVLLQAMDESRFDFSVPTLLISECVVVYMDKPSVTALCKGLADRFRQEAAAQALWVSYDMVNPHDAFGKVMRRNLGDGGINVPGFTDFPTLQAQGERFTHYGWEGASSITMATVFRDIISPRDRQRIGRLEIFDELEEWDMIMSHYCLTLVSLGVGVSSPLAQVKLNPSLRPDEGATGDAAAGATSKSSPSGWGSFAFSKGGK